VSIGLKADQRVLLIDDCRDRRDAEFFRSLPIIINMCSIAPLVEGQQGDVGIKVDRFSDLGKFVWQCDVVAIDVIGMINGHVEGFACPLLLCPFPQFLGAATIVSVSALAKGQVKLCGDLPAAMHHGIDVVAPCEKIFQGLSFLGSLRMEREHAPVDVEVKLLAHFIGTHGTEVAPGSDVVEKDFQSFHMIKVSRRHGKGNIRNVRIVCSVAMLDSK